MAQSADLAQMLENAVLSSAGIPASQLLTALCKGSEAVIGRYEKSGRGLWHLVGSPVAGYAGRNGVAKLKKEGDGCTPSGFFPLGYAFGCKEKPDTKMTFRPVTKRSVWVDDPASSRYNQWAEEDGDWSSAERLADYPDSYAYAVVIEYNTAPVIPGKGSAVFFHCGHKPTAGCIAVPEKDLLDILRWLDPDQSPGILIVKADK